ncbi:hypothetical protein Y032_0094g2691 [Ancylostoma ceylanicum]|nr:hypothetical protein Y032_0094g2691 [Ancylostoma ceylanicum]
MRELSTLKSQFSFLKKEVEITRKLSRTNWLIIFNMPLLFGMSKANALQQVMERCGYGKPVFNADRDLVSTELMFMNKTSNTCNMSLPTKRFTNEDGYAAYITNILETVYENVKNNIGSSQNQQKHHYDLRKRSNRKT